MDGKTDMLTLNDALKVRLLRLAMEPDRAGPPGDDAEQRGDLICDVLRCPLPGVDPPQNAASATAGGSRSAFRAIAGPPVRELLLDPKADIEVLRSVKECAKSLGSDCASKVQRDVFMAIYFAAIAAARLYHSQGITEHSETDLARFLGQFARAPWMPAELAELLARAARCRSDHL